MKAQKLIITEKEIDIDIEDITLLSIEEYEACKDIIPPIYCSWWLRSQSRDNYSASYVSSDGSVDYFGCYVDKDDNAVRPVLIYKSSNLQNGDKIKFADYRWTVISENMMLCDEVIGHTCFRNDWLADDSNDYEKSDIKVWLEDWLEKK